MRHAMSAIMARFVRTGTTNILVLKGRGAASRDNM